MSNTNPGPKCGSCDKTEADVGHPLKLCAKCRSAQYCSRECQKDDWKQHKKVCAINAAAASLQEAIPGSTSAGTTEQADSRTKNLQASIDKPFHKLKSKTWLHARPEEDVYKLLIDSYRLRMEDDYKFSGHVETESIYDGASNSRRSFQRFLKEVEKNSAQLPTWWSPEKAQECMQYGMGENWSSLSRAAGKSDIVGYYGNPLMPMQMRMFAEQVYGSGPGGQDGTAMLEMQMMAESGGIGSHLDVSGSMFGR